MSHRLSLDHCRAVVDASTNRLAILQDLVTMPAGTVWHRHCRCGSPDV